MNMTGKVISIGNSLGMILPARILKELALTKDSNLELRVEDGKLIVSESTPHKGWAEDAKKLHALNEDEIGEDSLDDLNGEWEW
jgi:antitoxin component of MazEF toxin-antitoxin module